VRVEGQDADAIGKTPPVAALGVASDDPVEKKVLDCLKSCYDPEIPVNIVDLGLIYLCEVSDLAPGSYKVDVRMTLTAPGCGMGGMIKDDVERKLAAIAGVTAVDVELVFDPPWDQSRMSEAAKLQLNMM